MQTKRIAVSGASGLVGSALVNELREFRHSVRQLVRDRARAGQRDNVYWNPTEGVVEAAALEGHDAVIHLAGEPLFQVWTRDVKQKIRDSRVRGTELLAEALAALDDPPPVFLCASAVGYYGADPGVQRLTEDSPKGEGFLADLVADWEAAAEPARAAGIRVVHLRFGIVLSSEGGALAAMLPAFRMGLGGTIGRGEGSIPWVAVHEVPGVVRFAMKDETLGGPVNVVAPEPTTQEALTDALADVLGRPSFMRVPEAFAKLLPGGMAEETVLADQPVYPARLQEHEYRHRLPDLREALRHELGIKVSA
ncbi:MAG TPA: TIGR01777 family oxidoreductase [Longimicrobiales bacterium]|nr:TIGR01777 family oxidoreductase [Longimicrobiales bacterium]